MSNSALSGPVAVYTSWSSPGPVAKITVSLPDGGPPMRVRLTSQGPAAEFVGSGSGTVTEISSLPPIALTVKLGVSTNRTSGPPLTATVKSLTPSRPA